MRLTFPILAVATALVPSVHAQPALPPIVAECHRLADTRVEPWDSQAMEKYKQDFLSACEQAIVVDPDGADTQLALGRAYSPTRQDKESVRLYRAAAAQDHAKACLSSTSGTGRGSAANWAGRNWSTAPRLSERCAGPPSWASPTPSCGWWASCRAVRS